MVYDFIIYRVACQKNIKTMMFHFSSFPHRLIYCERIFSETELQKQYRALLRNQDMDAYSLDTRTKEFLDAKRGTDYEKAMPDILKRNYSEIERSHSTRSYLFYLATNLGINIVARWYGTYIYNLLIKNISQKQGIKDKSNYVKRPDVAISASTKVTEVAKARQGFRNRLQKNKMRTIYSSLTNEVDLSQNFVYFPLHYQPELTTVPLGGHFTEQDQVIELVAGCLPAGWSIYVKEYVWQFAPRSQGERARSVEFYQRISRIPRVLLVKTDTPTFELIDRSKAVVTITGTAGWEGVARGKPCFLFGNAWYSGCEGTFSVQSQKDCERVFELIQKGYSVNQEKVTLFCRALDMVGVEAYANEKDGTGSGISPEQNINNLVEFFRQELAS